MKRQRVGKIFTNYVLYKRFISGIYKEHLKINNEKQTTKLKMTKDLGRRFSKEGHKCQ
jgi:hypothetical protein